MKTSLICGAALAILGVAAAPLIGQTQTTPPSTEANYVQTSKVIGTKVKTAQGEEIGVVKDVVLERSNGCLAYTVLSTGGGGARVTGRSKLVAVPWSVFVVSPDASYLTVNVERDRIYNAPVFEYSRISDAAYILNVYSHFSVSAGTSSATMATAGSTTQGTSGESTSEATGNSSGKKSSSRKSTSENSSAESETIPSSKKSSHKKGSSEGTSEAAPTPGGEQE